ncbi:MAG: hypothetical protein K2G85_02110 [Muribaculaceae bacterium]|nr:hypothetical protein [Muribaculaceae bacterium]
MTLPETISTKSVIVMTLGINDVFPFNNKVRFLRKNVPARLLGKTNKVLDKSSLCMEKARATDSRKGTAIIE